MYGNTTVLVAGRLVILLLILTQRSMNRREQNRVTNALRVLAW